MMTTKILSCSFEGLQNFLVKNKMKRLNKYSKAIEEAREVIMMRTESSIILMMSGAWLTMLEPTSKNNSKVFPLFHSQVWHFAYDYTRNQPHNPQTSQRNLDWD